jgi:hypothetical protein
MGWVLIVLLSLEAIHRAIRALPDEDIPRFFEDLKRLIRSGR